MIGTSLGHYHVEALLGVGGMGEVYRARDTKLGRGVAIKVLPDVFRSDPERIARLEREAKILASLNHPHIAALHGMEESEGRHFLVMELVEGETLAERLARGPMRVEDTIAIALQIADALEAAHERTVVHRDLKPANVKLTSDGRVKVLDFGLAKAFDAEPPSAAGALTHSPTVNLAGTQAGMILGTAAYMSPEQAKGMPADHRSDVFSFGVVLYEMLTGRQPFLGETAPDVLASVLAREADLSALPPNLNSRLADLVRRCLDKHPRRRWQAIGDVRAELEVIAAAPGAAPRGSAPPATRPLWKQAVLAAGLLTIGGAVAAMLVWNLRPASPRGGIARFTFNLPEGQQFPPAGRRFVDISPDGSQIVYVANQRLFLRSLSQFEARAIPGTENALGITSPVFSPDGQSIAFFSFADLSLKRIGISGGSPVTVCPAQNPWGLSWEGDALLYGQGPDGIMRVPASGGTPEKLVSVKAGEVAENPQMLPGGQSVLFTVASGAGVDRWDRAQIVVQNLESTTQKVLFTGGADGRYLPTGHLVYANQRVLFAVPVDLARLVVTGDAVPVVEGVRRAPGQFINPAGTQFAVSAAGSVVYIPGSVATTGSPRLALRDSRGVAEGLKVPPNSYVTPRFSPDGKQIAVAIDDGARSNIWIHDLSAASSIRQLTFAGRNGSPVWTADGQRVAFQSDREGDLAVWWQRADGGQTAERLTKPATGESHTPTSWSPRGDRFLLSVSKDSAFSVWTFSLADKKAEPFGVASSKAAHPNAMFSPDGRWILYHSDEPEGTNALWVQPFPATGVRYRLASGASLGVAAWSPDGKSIYYVGGGPVGDFSVLRIATQPSFAFSESPSMPRLGFVGLGPGAVRNWDMSGTRRIGVVEADDSSGADDTQPQIRVVINWQEELKQRVPTR